MAVGPVDLEWWPSGTIPAPASLVWCAFPDHLIPDQPSPKSRPGLVFKVRALENPPDERFLVLVAYGTSKLKTGKRPNDYTIANSATLDVLRLPRATRFDLDKMVWLPWAKPFFISRGPDDRFATPVISVLPAGMQRNLGWTMAKREARGLNGAYHGAKVVGPDESDDS